MGDLLGEFLASPSGYRLYEMLEKAQDQAHQKVFACARGFVGVNGEVQYHMGIADGLGRALNLIEETRRTSRG